MTTPAEAPHDQVARHSTQPTVLSSLRRVYLTAILGVAGVALIAIALHVIVARSSSAERHGHEVVQLAREAMRLASDREAWIRDYLLTHSAAAHQAELDAREPMRIALDSLVAVADDDPDQQRRAEELRRAIALWDTVYARPTVDRIARAAPDSARPVELLAGRPLFDEARRRYDSLSRAQDVLDERRLRLQRFNQWSALLGVLAGLWLLWQLVAWLRRGVISQTTEVVARRMQLEEQAVALEEQAVALKEQLVQSRSLAQELEVKNRELSDSVDALRQARGETAAAYRDRAASAGALAVMIERMPVAVAFFDADLRFRRLNQAFAALGGSSATVPGYVGRTLEEALPAFAAALTPRLVGVRETRAPLAPAEIEVPGDSTSSRRHFLASLFPVVEERDADRPGVGVALLETTEQRLLEAQLLKSQKMEAIGRLAGGIAHDFNNVLTAITGFSQLAANELRPGSSARADIEQVQLAATRASTLTRQLLAFSRQQLLRPRPLNLNTVVSELEVMLRRLIGENIKLETQLAPALPLVLADPSQIEQVLLNLVVNARDAMPDGGTLSIETEEVELDAEWVRRHQGAQVGTHAMLAVSDTGIGMDAPTIERIFEPFFTTKAMGKGTGLGLATVYGIVKQTGGSVWVNSEQGRGTTFRVYLPRFSGSEETPIASRPEPDMATQRGVVLVVEDDESVRLATRRALESAGYTVHQATNGVEALEVVERLRGAVDVALTDLVMPEMGGHDFAQRLASRWPGVRVAFTTGHSWRPVDREAVLRPGDVFLEKPYTPALLLAKVRDALRHAPV